MLRPAYAAIGHHARDGQPAIVFVPTRKHAIMAALDLLTHAAADGAPHKFRQVRAEGVVTVPADYESAGSRLGKCWEFAGRCTGCWLR